MKAFSYDEGNSCKNKISLFLKNYARDFIIYIFLIASISGSARALEIEVENMRFKEGGHPVPDGWAFSTPGYIADSLEIDNTGFYRFRIFAKESVSQSTPPQMLIRIAGRDVGPIFVNEAFEIDYKSLCHLEPGKYLIEIHNLNNLSGNELILNRLLLYKVEFDEWEWFNKISSSIMNNYLYPWQYPISSWQIEELVWGIANAYELTGDAEYLNYVRSFLDSHISNSGELDIEIKDIVPGVLLAWLYHFTNETKYRLAAKRIGDYLLNEYPRTGDGGFVHLPSYPTQLWVETLGGLGRFLGWLGYVTGDSTYFKEGINQFLIHSSHLQDSQIGLLYHAWDEEYSAEWADPATGLSPVFWARGNGWFLRGLVDFLEFLPNEYSQKNELIDILGKLVTGLISYRDESTGLWKTVLDSVQNPNNYIETGASVLITYGIQKAIRLNLIPATYQPVVDLANRSLYQKIYEKANLRLVITGLANGVEPGDMSNYLSSPIDCDEVLFFGSGLFLQEKSEIIKSGINGISISSFQVTEISDSSAVIICLTTRPSKVRVQYGVDENYGFSSELSREFSTYHEVRLSNLEPDTEYHFRIYARDEINNEIMTNDHFFKTLPLMLLSFSDISITSGIAGLEGNDNLGGHGTGFADVDGDNLADLYITMLFDGPIADLFFHNEGNCIFDEQGASRGISDFDGGSHGLCFADLDNDGDYDLINGTTYDINGQPAANNIFRNDGSGYFEEITFNTDLSNNLWPTRAIIAFDMDSDGDLDIFAVSNYRGTEDPSDEMNEIYCNEGDFNFVSVDTSVLRFIPAAQGASAVDYDNDGDIDLFIANRTGTMNIAENDGSGNFSLIDPIERGIYHQAKESISFADVNKDSLLDLILVGGNGDHCGYLYINNGNGIFSFQTQFENVQGYMAGFADLDNDSDFDIIFAGDQKCYLNDGNGNFVEGPNIPITADDPRSISFGDIDNDGDLDFAVGCKRSHNFLIKNNLKSGNWLKVKLENKQGQAGAFGTRVLIYDSDTPGKLLAMQEAQSSYGYLGQNEPVLHFGVGDRLYVDVIAKFLDGEIVELRRVATNQTIFIKPNFQQEEIISKPKVAVLDSSLIVGKEISFIAHKSYSNLNHPLEYQFFWGDGSTSAWSDSMQFHVYEEPGNFYMRARARCKIDTIKVSPWSDSIEIAPRLLSCSVISDPDSGGKIYVIPLKEGYRYGDSLQIRAEAFPGFIFSHWEGTFSGQQNPFNINITEDIQEKAIFIGQEEEISQPVITSWVDTLFIKERGKFECSGASSNLGHKIEYKFYWGDGESSVWGDSIQYHVYDSSGTFWITARARCAEHNSVLSEMSDTIKIIVRPIYLSIDVIPDSGGRVEITPLKQNYCYQDTILLEPIANEGLEFEHWGGDIVGDGAIQKLILTHDIEIKCFFKPIAEQVLAPVFIKANELIFRKQEAVFIASGAENNLGHQLQFQFDWGDGNLSYWGDSIQTRIYLEDGNFQVKARSRCSVHKQLVSDWCAPITINVRGCRVQSLVIPEEGGNIALFPQKADYDYDESIRITAIPSPNYNFVNWGNNSNDTLITKQVKISSDTTFIAKFKLSSGILGEINNIPKEYELHPNFPNPFNMETFIAFSIPEPCDVELQIYNLCGQEVMTLESAHFSPGKYIRSWSGTDKEGNILPTGIYWIVLKTSNKRLMSKAVILR